MNNELESLVNTELEETYAYLKKELDDLESCDNFNYALSGLHGKIINFVRKRLENKPNGFKEIYLEKFRKKLEDLSACYDAIVKSEYEDIGNKIVEISEDLSKI